MEATNKPSKANDFALAKAMNEQVYQTFIFVWMGDAAGLSEFHEIPNLNRAYVLLVNELEKIYSRNPELLEISPVPIWKRFNMLKNFTAEISDYMREENGRDLEHIARVERLCIIAGVENPTFTAEQQKIMDIIDAHTTEYAFKGKEKLDNKGKDRQIPTYSLTYELDGSILINNVFILKKAHAGSSTERLLEQALNSPYELFKPDIGQTSRNLSTVLSSAGFTKELRQLFFPTVSNSKGIIFRPTISRKQADDEGIDTIELDTKLKALGAETEPKST